MTYSVYQHWDPLRVCIVGRSYPPEFYSWIQIPHVRNLFERIAQETEEDYQNIIKKLQSFGVKIMRPDLCEPWFQDNVYIPPPMTPRDYMVMIGNTFYNNYGVDFKKSYADIRDLSWPDCQSEKEFSDLPMNIQKEFTIKSGFNPLSHTDNYSAILSKIVRQGNKINKHSGINGAMMSRIGRDLYFGTEGYDQDQIALKKIIDAEFPDTRNHIVNTGGHSDGTYCPVCPGLIISLRDVPTYADTFPGWEVVYLPGQSWEKVQPFLKLKATNRGRWWIPGFEQDQSVIDVVETWLSDWVGYVEETVFDVNMLIINPKNVMVFNENDLVFEALARYGITPHVVPFRHRYFWDSGIHCVTTDLHRDGTIQDFFPERNNHES